MEPKMVEPAANGRRTSPWIGRILAGVAITLLIIASLLFYYLRRDLAERMRIAREKESQQGRNFDERDWPYLKKKSREPAPGATDRR